MTNRLEEIAHEQIRHMERIVQLIDDGVFTTAEFINGSKLDCTAETRAMNIQAIESWKQVIQNHQAKGF